MERQSYTPRDVQYVGCRRSVFGRAPRNSASSRYSREPLQTPDTGRLTHMSFTGNLWCYRPQASSSMGIINTMAEPAEHPTAPTLTVDPPPGPPVTGEGPRRGGPNRVYQVLAWVGIVAGVVFVVAVVFFSGFFMGTHSGRGHGHFGGHQSHGVHFFHRA